MKNLRSLIIFLLIAAAILLIPLYFSKNKVKEVALTVAFYNVENLFDTLDAPGMNDQEFLPVSKKQWDADKYRTKLQNLAKVIRQLDGEGNPPEILGLAEIENRQVLEDLVREQGLGRFAVVHEDSPDRRGIDVALLYDSTTIRLTGSRTIAVNKGSGNPTRDILYAHVVYGGQHSLHLLVNHWPSRYGGKKKSEPGRIAAAKSLRTVVDSILAVDSLAQIIVMGDFNDEPDDRSISGILKAGTANADLLYNPFLMLQKSGAGSYMYKGKWDMLDQIMISRGLWDYESLDYIQESESVFNQPWLLQTEGRYKGYPLRTFGGNNYLGGYSDHLPVRLNLYNTGR